MGNSPGVPQSWKPCLLGAPPHTRAPAGLRPGEPPTKRVAGRGRGGGKVRVRLGSSRLQQGNRRLARRYMFRPRQTVQDNACAHQIECGTQQGEWDKRIQYSCNGRTWLGHGGGAWKIYEGKARAWHSTGVGVPRRWGRDGRKGLER